MSETVHEIAESLEIKDNPVTMEQTFISHDQVVLDINQSNNDLEVKTAINCKVSNIEPVSENASDSSIVSEVHLTVNKIASSKVVEKSNITFKDVLATKSITKIEKPIEFNEEDILKIEQNLYNRDNILNDKFLGIGNSPLSTSEESTVNNEINIVAQEVTNDLIRDVSNLTSTDVGVKNNYDGSQMNIDVIDKKVLDDTPINQSTSNSAASNTEVQPLIKIDNVAEIADISDSNNSIQPTLSNLQKNDSLEQFKETITSFNHKLECPVRNVDSSARPKDIVDIIHSCPWLKQQHLEKTMKSTSGKPGLTLTPLLPKDKIDETYIEGNQKKSHKEKPERPPKHKKFVPVDLADIESKDSKDDEPIPPSTMWGKDEDSTSTLFPGATGVVIDVNAEEEMEKQIAIVQSLDTFQKEEENRKKLETSGSKSNIRNRDNDTESGRGKIHVNLLDSSSDLAIPSTSHDVSGNLIDKFGRVNGFTEKHLYMGKGARKKEQEVIQTLNESKTQPENQDVRNKPAGFPKKSQESNVDDLKVQDQIAHQKQQERPIHGRSRKEVRFSDNLSHQNQNYNQMSQTGKKSQENSQSNIGQEKDRDRDKNHMNRFQREHARAINKTHDNFNKQHNNSDKNTDNMIRGQDNFRNQNNLNRNGSSDRFQNHDKNQNHHDDRERYFMPRNEGSNKNQDNFNRNDSYGNYGRNHDNTNKNQNNFGQNNDNSNSNQGHYGRSQDNLRRDQNYSNTSIMNQDQYNRNQHSFNKTNDQQTRNQNSFNRTSDQQTRNLDQYNKNQNLSKQTSDQHKRNQNSFNQTNNQQSRIQDPYNNYRSGVKSQTIENWDDDCLKSVSKSPASGYLQTQKDLKSTDSLNQQQQQCLQKDTKVVEKKTDLHNKQTDPKMEKQNTNANLSRQNIPQPEISSSSQNSREIGIITGSKQENGMPSFVQCNVQKINCTLNTNSSKTSQQENLMTDESLITDYVSEPVNIPSKPNVLMDFIGNHNVQQALGVNPTMYNPASTASQSKTQEPSTNSTVILPQYTSDNRVMQNISPHVTCANTSFYPDSQLNPNAQCYKVAEECSSTNQLSSNPEYIMQNLPMDYTPVSNITDQVARVSELAVLPQEVQAVTKIISTLSKQLATAQGDLLALEVKLFKKKSTHSSKNQSQLLHYSTAHTSVQNCAVQSNAQAQLPHFNTVQSSVQNSTLQSSTKSQLPNFSAAHTSVENCTLQSSTQSQLQPISMATSQTTSEAHIQQLPAEYINIKYMLPPPGFQNVISKTNIVQQEPYELANSGNYTPVNMQQLSNDKIQSDNLERLLNAQSIQMYQQQQQQAAAHYQQYCTNLNSGTAATLPRVSKIVTMSPAPDMRPTSTNQFYKR